MDESETDFNFSSKHTCAFSMHDCNPGLENVLNSINDHFDSKPTLGTTVELRSWKTRKVMEF